MTSTLVTGSSVVFDTMLLLADCLCTQIVPDVCFCGVVPGEAPAFDYHGDCDTACGMAWVRLANAYPAAMPGVPSEQPGNCAVALGVEVEVGVARCIGVGNDTGGPPTYDELLQSTELQVADMLAMRRAVVCCDALVAKDTTISAYSPFGPDGGMVGGTMTVSTIVY